MNTLIFILSLCALSSALTTITTEGDLYSTYGANFTGDLSIMLPSPGTVTINGTFTIYGNFSIGDGVNEVTLEILSPYYLIIEGDLNLNGAVITGSMSFGTGYGSMIVDSTSTVEGFVSSLLVLAADVNFTFGSPSIVTGDVEMDDGALLISYASSFWVYGDITGGEIILNGSVTNFAGTIDSNVVIKSGAEVNDNSPIHFLKSVDCSGSLSFTNAARFSGSELIMRAGSVLETTYLLLDDSTTMYILDQINLDGVSINGGTIWFETELFSISDIGGTYQSDIYIIDDYLVQITSLSNITGNVTLENIAILSLNAPATIGNLILTENSILQVTETLTITGDLKQENGCVTEILVNESNVNFIIEGNAVLDGTLDLTLIRIPFVGDRIQILSYSSHTGSYGTVHVSPDSEYELQYDTDAMYIYFTGATSTEVANDISVSEDMETDDVSEDSMASNSVKTEDTDTGRGDAYEDFIVFVVVLVVAVSILVIITIGLLIFKCTN